MFALNAYQTVVFHIFNFTAPAWRITGITFFIFGGIGSLFLELHNVLKLCYYNLKGKVSDLTEYGLNPSKITPEQAKLPAIILIPGLRHSHGVWIEFAKSCKRSETKNPLFTVNLSKKPLRDLSQTIAKIKEIYLKAGSKDVKIDLVGYSAGGIPAIEFLSFGKIDNLEHSENVRDIILLGTPCPRKINSIKTKNVYLIRGNLDFIAPPEKVTNSWNVNAGHFGLPFSHETHTAIQTLINLDPSEKVKYSHFHSEFW